MVKDGLSGEQAEMMEAEIAAIRKALKRIDHTSVREREIGQAAETALDIIERYLLETAKPKKRRVTSGRVA